MKKVIYALMALWVASVIVCIPLSFCAGLESRSFTISIGAAATTTQTVSIIGIPRPSLIQEIKVVIPDTDNDRTFTFYLTDTDSFARYSVAALAENTSHIIKPGRIVATGYTLGMLPSGATGNAITITIKVTYWD